MYKKNASSWRKHLDFLVFDIIVVIIAYVISCYYRYSQGIEYYNSDVFPRVGFVLVSVYLVVTLFTSPYKNILRRNRYQEVVAVLKQQVFVYTVFTVAMYITGIAATFSRTVYITTGVFGYIGICIYRIAYKNLLRKRIRRNSESSKMLIVADDSEMLNCLRLIERNEYNAFAIAGLVVLDRNMTGEKIMNYPVVADIDTLHDYILNEVVDEIILCTDDKPLEKQLMDFFLETGITVHKSLRVDSTEYPNATLERVGGQMVMTTSVNTVSGIKLTIKRIVDIIGSLLGLILCGIIYIFVAPQIRKADPGPVFFAQTRVGKNGRQFKMYKFRSMYMDAEERKAELMAQNDVEDGMTFKMEDDPRILPGIGHKLRNSSLDEFPQFYNVLKGDMSLVGTRPPTVDEYKKYEAHHKMRLSFKPGITGMWQISGRSDIKDFEEIVKMDNDYIKNWSMMADVIILLKTIGVVLRQDGAR